MIILYSTVSCVTREEFSGCKGWLRYERKQQPRDFVEGEEYLRLEVCRSFNEMVLREHGPASLWLRRNRVLSR